MLYRPWRIARPEKSQIQAVAAHTGLAPLACGVLCARGKTTPAALDEMLGTGEKLSPPGLLLNMDKAVSRILAAVDSGERIAVFGDCRSLRIGGLDGSRAEARDLLGGEILPVPVSGGSLSLSGEQVRAIGLSRATRGDRSAPGLIITISGG